MNEEARGEALVSVEEIICSHAVGTDSDNSARRQWSGLQVHRKRLAELGATETKSCTRHSCQLAPKQTSGIECQNADGQGRTTEQTSCWFFRVKHSLEMQLPDGLSSERHAWAAAAGEHMAVRFIATTT